MILKIWGYDIKTKNKKHIKALSPPQTKSTYSILMLHKASISFKQNSRKSICKMSLQYLCHNEDIDEWLLVESCLSVATSLAFNWKEIQVSQLHYNVHMHIHTLIYVYAYKELTRLCAEMSRVHSQWVKYTYTYLHTYTCICRLSRTLWMSYKKKLLLRCK